MLGQCWQCGRTCRAAFIIQFGWLDTTALPPFVLLVVSTQALAIIMVVNERIIFTPDNAHPERFLPQVAGAGAATRAFEVDDMNRVEDFPDEDLPEAPPDGALMFGTDAESDDLKFPSYHFCLRGGYLFYFDLDDVEDSDGVLATYHDVPLGVVPLRHVTVQYPPGGRRCFREHAHTPARTGYEIALVHIPEEEGEDVAESSRPVVFLVSKNLSTREKWAAAMRERAEIDRPTTLKGGYTRTTPAPKQQKKAMTLPDDDSEEEANGDAAKPEVKVEQPAEEPETPNEIMSEFTKKKKQKSAKKPATSESSSFFKKKHKPREVKTVKQQVLAISNDEDLAAAVVEFGISDFSEKIWMDEYFQVHNDFDAPSKCRQMEQWQTEMKKSLKGAVLEQYEYFVQASGEMTTMGKEVQSLKSMVETQIDILKEMKDVDFLGALNEQEIDPKDEVMGRDASEQPDAIEVSKVDDPSMYSEMTGDKHVEEDDEDDARAPKIEVPDWLQDADEEISATIREGRYDDAIKLVLKARNEINDLIDKHDRPTAYRLRKKDLSMLRSLKNKVATLADRISHRLEETLRRKNEALKQASKRERSDPHMGGSALISPCALNDDALYLHLLVKLGRTQEAANAYSIRRSLLLLETIHERPISGSGTVDLVIYSAQLSQSFFSCLASSVEGFLDLFIAGSDKKVDDMSVGDASSIQSHTPHIKNVPAGAVASVVLWCDTELTKFAAAFGGTRILANLALSPPPSRGTTQRILGQEDVGKERRNAIEVASQCIEQAFRYASNNLDTVGLPLTPRLAELLRGRLKGCEAEVAELLDDRWNILTSDWRSYSNGGR